MIIIVTTNQIKQLNAAKDRWLQVTGYEAKTKIVKRWLPDWSEVDPNSPNYWNKAVRIFQQRYIEPREKLPLSHLKSARQKWEQTTGLKALPQSVKDVLPDFTFSLNTERDWLLITSLYLKRYPPKAVAQVLEAETIEQDTIIANSSTFKQCENIKAELLAQFPPIILPPTPVASPSTPKDPVEQRMSNKLAQILGGIREAANPSGRVDVLTKLYVIEVKKACNWKHGIGQALVYQFYYPDKKPVLFLFGEDINLYRDLAIEHCNRLGVLYREESQHMNEGF